MKLFEKIRKRRAKRHVKKLLKIISKLSWKELDDIIPKPNYKDCFAFDKEKWSKVEFAYPINITERRDVEQ